MDVEALLPLMRDFYLHERLDFDEQRSRRLMLELIAAPVLGRLFIIADSSEVAGYMVMTLGYSLEFHGRFALLDELYVRPEQRGRGLGTAALNHVKRWCGEHDVASVLLEADWVNQRGRALYLRSGFKDHRRHLMSLRLDAD